MAVVARPFPAALPHGELQPVFPDLHFVMGTVAVGAGVRFGRAMTIVRQPTGLVLINSVRLSEAGLAALERLGKVTDVVRLAANHGMDDPFYADRYGAKVWAVRGQRYTAGFNTSRSDTYFTPHVEMDERGPLPIEGARLRVIHSQPPEGLLLLPQHDGVLVAGDCLQNWAEPDPYCTWLGRVMLRLGGFIKPCNVGPGWLKQTKPPRAALRAILELPFSHVLPSHGTPVVGDARERFRPTLERFSA